MKKKQLRKLIGLFEFLPLAGEILSGKTIPEAAETSQIRTAWLSLREIRDDTANTFLVEVFDEIDHNLYYLPDSRMEFYVEDILRGFAGVSPFLCCLPGNKLSEIVAAEDDFPQECRATLRLLSSSFGEDTDIDDDNLSDAAKYVFSCYALLLFFSKTLDSRCLHFKLNLYDIQDRLGIYIFYDRDYNDLINAGYWDKVLEMVSKDETPPKALPESSEPESPQIRPFPEWLHYDDPEKLAQLCKQIFNARCRPKDYAVMLCLLKDHHYIDLEKRIDFYDSWYAFIGRPFPKHHNYNSINKHIDSYKGIQFINDTDPYYLDLKKTFENKLTS